MRFVNADKLIDQIKLRAGCAECNSYEGVRCRACPWDDAIAIVDGFADNPDNSIEFEDDDFQRVLDYQKESEAVSVGAGILNAICLAEDMMDQPDKFERVLEWGDQDILMPAT